MLCAVSDVSVLLADPHPRLRAALASLLAHEDGVCVVGSVGTAQEAAVAMRRRRPHVLVTDLALVSMHGGLLGAWGPVDASVPIVVTGFEAPKTIEPLLLAHGAAAYVSKEDLADRLPAVVRAAAALLPEGPKTLPLMGET